MISTLLKPTQRPFRKVMKKLKGWWTKSWLKGLLSTICRTLDNLFWNLCKASRRRKRIRHKNNYSKRYYIYASRRRGVRIATKTTMVPTLPTVRVFTSIKKQRPMSTFYPGLFTIAIDNCASKCMTHKLDDLIDKNPCRVPIKDLGHAQGTYMGTVKWKWQDDKGRHSFLKSPMFSMSKTFHSMS